MNATIKIRPRDRAYEDPSQASRPFSIDRKGFVLSEGAGVVVLTAEETARHYGLKAKAEVMGIGWSSDAHHFARPNKHTVIRAITEAIDDAGLKPNDVEYINAHGTSTDSGDSAEVDWLRAIFGKRLKDIPITSNKSQIGHTLGASAAIEDALTIEGMQRGVILPTINYIPDPQFDGLDFVADRARQRHYEVALSNAFGFGGTNCCIIFRGV
jgi:3-oxoacyl-[acyl-carrier-protein] synthase II